MKKCFVSLALTLASLYLVLSVSAVACLFAHESESRSSHHHTGGVTHSSLCTWACLANQTVDLPATTPQTQPPHFVSLLPLLDSSVSPVVFQESAQSRAPPRS